MLIQIEVLNETRIELVPSLKLNIVPENGWLENDISFWEDIFFRGYISFREASRLKHETSVCKQTSLLVMSLPTPA